MMKKGKKVKDRSKGSFKPSNTREDKIQVNKTSKHKNEVKLRHKITLH